MERPVRAQGTDADNEVISLVAQPILSCKAHACAADQLDAPFFRRLLNERQFRTGSVLPERWRSAPFYLALACWQCGPSPASSRFRNSRKATMLLVDVTVCGGDQLGFNLN
jgi:hypothetical protein